MRSSLLERLAMRVLGTEPQGRARFGASGIGEYYAPETREDFVKAYVNRVWVQRSVNYIANSVDKVPIECKVGGEWYSAEQAQDDLRPISDGRRLLELLDRPTSRDPATTFFSWSTKWGQIVGDWIWEIVPAVDGGIAELYPLFPHQMRRREGGYRYWPEGAGDWVDYDEIEYAPGQKPPVIGANGDALAIFGRYPSPVDEFYGMPPLRGAKDDIISEYYAVRYDHRFFRNSARPDIVIGFKSKLDREQRRENKEAWDDFKGVESSHRAAVMDGDPSVTLLSQNPRDVEYQEGRKLAREGECGAFGVPPVLVGILDRATYSNYSEAKVIFWGITMVPLMDFNVSWAKWTLLPFFPDVEDIRHRCDQIPEVQEAEEWKHERARQDVAGGLITNDEGREEIGKDKLERPGETDVLRMPLSLVGVTSSDDAPEPEPPPPGESTNGNGNGAVSDEEAAQIVADAVNKGIKASSWRSTSEGVTAWLHQRGLLLERFSARAQTELSSHFRQVRDDVLGIVNSLEKAATDLEAALRAYDWDTNEKTLSQIVDALVTALADQALDLTQVLISTEKLDPVLKDTLITRTLTKLQARPDGIQQVSKRVKAEIIDQVRLGIEHGLTYRDIAKGGVFDVGPAGDREAEQLAIKGIQGVFDEYTTWQAQRIARTESAVTFNHAGAHLMREAGIKEVDIIDGEKDEACAAANGQRWTLEEYESEPIGHPNCTRVGLPVVEVPASAAA